MCGIRLEFQDFSKFKPKKRHLQSTYQQKARRLRKNKSRNFHRHLKRREKKEAEKQALQTEIETEEKAIKGSLYF